MFSRIFPAKCRDRYGLEQPYRPNVNDGYSVAWCRVICQAIVFLKEVIDIMINWFVCFRMFCVIMFWDEICRLLAYYL